MHVDVASITGRGRDFILLCSVGLHCMITAKYLSAEGNSA